MHVKVLRRFLSLALVASLCGLAYAAEQQADAKKAVAIGDDLPDFTMKDLQGKEHTLSQFKGKPVVLVFVSFGCPWSRGADPVLSKLAEEYKDKAHVIGIDSDRGNTPEKIAAYAKENGVTYPILKDEGNVYADQLNAKQTPEVFIVDKDGKLIYHGAVDDRKSDTETGATNYIKAALDETLAGKPVTIAHKKQWGCGIKRVEKSKEG